MNTNKNTSEDLKKKTPLLVIIGGLVIIALLSAFLFIETVSYQAEYEVPETDDVYESDNQE